MNKWALITGASSGIGAELARVYAGEQHNLVLVARREERLANLAALTRLFLAPMVAAGEGRILNVASTTGFHPLPGMSLYAAGKAFIISFSEALAEELKGSGVSVTVFCPGPTDTEMVELTQNQFEGTPQIPSLMLADARQVAEQGFDAAKRREVVRIPGISNRITTLFMQSQPRWLVRRLGGVIGRRFLMKQ